MKKIKVGRQLWSRLSEQIEQGIYGIENMDWKYLVEGLLENESELFE